MPSKPPSVVSSGAGKQSLQSPKSPRSHVRQRSNLMSDVVISVASLAPPQQSQGSLDALSTKSPKIIREAEYGEEVEIGDEYEFYSNPNSRPQSVRGASPTRHPINIETETEPHPLGAKPQQEKENGVKASGDTLHNAGSTWTMCTQDELARQAARDDVEKENSPDGAAGHTLRTVLIDPESRKGLESLRAHRPWFLMSLTAIQVVIVGISLLLNYQWTGSVVQTSPNFNYMIGPAPGILIQMGARFLPCIRNTSLNVEEAVIICPAGIRSDFQAVDPTTGVESPACTLEQICGLGGFNGGNPNQWFRFIIPIFQHGGIVHLACNMMFQIKTGFQLERDFGWWRVAAIYFISGIGGFIFGGNYNGLTPSVGCSGALFGLMACLVLDLFQNWKLIVRPGLELFKLSVVVVLSFAVGMLPYIDNFAHVGGFVTGILAGLVFMPTISYSVADRRVKLGLTIVAVPAIAAVYVILLRSFYLGENNCNWCKYINCIPGLPWCEQKWNQFGG